MNINNDITILSKRYSTLDSDINEISSETKGEMTVQIVDVKRKMESMEQAVDRQRKETNGYVIVNIHNGCFLKFL
jgi:archaellum component FlaC